MVTKKTLTLNEEDLHNLYDILYVVHYGTLKNFKCLEWYAKFFDDVQRIVVPEIYEVEE